MSVASQIAQLQDRASTWRSNYEESLDTVWMLSTSALIFFMHAGFTLLEAGTARMKSAQHVLVKNIVVVVMAFLAWYAIGYALARGVVDNPGRFLGHSGFFMDSFFEHKEKFRQWLFQGAFCATSCTIVSGAMAERTKLSGFAVYVVAITGVIYPVVAYWCWSGEGFLAYDNDEGRRVNGLDFPPYMDFAGSGVVHLVGGIGAVCGAVAVGPRHGRYDNPDDFLPHNIPLLLLGTILLWFGWYGFNGGSTQEMHELRAAHRAGRIVTNTTLAPAIAGPMVFLLRATVFPPHRFDVAALCNGILCGLVAITAACPYVKPWESVAIGAIAGFVYQAFSMLLERLQIDDVVDAAAVHGAGGLWGILAIGLFGDPDLGLGGNGVLYGGNQFGVQAFAAVCIIAWAAVLSTLVLVPVRVLGLLRMSDDEQDEGPDSAEYMPRKAYASQDLAGAHF